MRITTGLLLASLLLIGPASAIEPSHHCGAARESACKLLGYKLLGNEGAPGALFLEIETENGSITFVSTKAAMEQFSRDLIESVQRSRGGEKL